MQAFIAIAQFGHFEVTPSFCLVAPELTWTTIPSKEDFQRIHHQAIEDVDY